jgi:hypothetical protein
VSISAETCDLPLGILRLRLLFRRILRNPTASRVACPEVEIHENAGAQDPFLFLVSGTAIELGANRAVLRIAHAVLIGLPRTQP